MCSIRLEILNVGVTAATNAEALSAPCFMQCHSLRTVTYRSRPVGHWNVRSLVETFEASASSRRRRCRVGLPKSADSERRCLGGRLHVESDHSCISVV